jgi:hypothetical protein
MSDLSKVLGDLYESGDATTTPEHAEFQASAPAWADEDRLDEAFSQWTPGPPADAPAAEREMSIVLDMPEVPAARLDDEMAAAMNAALAQPAPEVHVAAWETSAPESVPAYRPEPAYEPAPALMDLDMTSVFDTAPTAFATWQRTDDDILPGPSGRVPRARKEKQVKQLRMPKLAKATPAPVAITPLAPVIADENPMAPVPTMNPENPPLKVFGITLRRK